MARGVALRTVPLGLERVHGQARPSLGPGLRSWSTSPGKRPVQWARVTSGTSMTATSRTEIQVRPLAARGEVVGRQERGARGGERGADPAAERHRDELRARVAPRVEAEDEQAPQARARAHGAAARQSSEQMAPLVDEQRDRQHARRACDDARDCRAPGDPRSEQRGPERDRSVSHQKSLVHGEPAYHALPASPSRANLPRSREESGPWRSASSTACAETISRRPPGWRPRSRRRREPSPG